MEDLDLRGIVWIPNLNKYRVFFKRKGVKYNLGFYANIVEAIEVRDKWLEDYDEMVKTNKYFEPKKYTREWYQWMHLKNVKDFTSYNGTGVKVIVLKHDEEWPPSPLKQIL